MRPGSCFVVNRPGFEASVEDADEAVGQLAEGDIVADTAVAFGRRSRRVLLEMR
jgi:hypothetical protein